MAELDAPHTCLDLKCFLGEWHAGPCMHRIDPQVIRDGLRRARTVLRPALTSTRTHTHYFAGEELGALVDAFTALEADARDRRGFVGVAARTEMDERLELVRLAIRRLSDPAG